MKKSSFVTMLLGTVSGMLFALGMCMALIPEWDAFKPGIVFGCVGLVLALILCLCGEKWSIRAYPGFRENNFNNHCWNYRSIGFRSGNVFLSCMGKNDFGNCYWDYWNCYSALSNSTDKGN